MKVAFGNASRAKWAVGLFAAGVVYGAPAHAQNIVGGEETADFPAVGALAYSYGPDFVSFCSATLIDERWVMTAAHCAEPALESMERGQTVYFVSGLTMDERDVDEVVELADFYVHPSYEGAGWYDIALGRLDGPGLPSIEPMPVNTDPYRPAWDGTMVTHVGFGTINDADEGGGTRRVVDVPVYDTMADLILTYDEERISGICHGDSGGAALRVDDETGVLELVAVHSLGFNLDHTAPSCEGELSVGGSTLVQRHQSWWQDTLASEDIEPDTVDPSETDDPEDELEEEEEERPPLVTSEAPQPEAKGCAHTTARVGWSAMLAMVLGVGWRRRG